MPFFLFIVFQQGRIQGAGVTLGPSLQDFSGALIRIPFFFRFLLFYKYTCQFDQLFIDVFLLPN